MVADADPKAASRPLLARFYRSDMAKQRENEDMERSGAVDSDVGDGVARPATRLSEQGFGPQVHGDLNEFGASLSDFRLVPFRRTPVS
jgi:hypothetical protein